MARSPEHRFDPLDHLPLRPVEFQVLVILGDGERHGYAILQEAEERGQGRAVPGLATLYRAIRRLEHRGLIARCASVERSADDDRRRPYGLTEAGRAVAAAETRRLSALLGAAQAGGFIPLDGAG